MELNNTHYGKKITDEQKALIRKNTTQDNKIWALDKANEAGFKITYNTLLRVIEQYRNISKNNILTINLLLDIAKRTEDTKKAMEEAI